MSFRRSLTAGLGIAVRAGAGLLILLFVLCLIPGLHIDERLPHTADRVARWIVGHPRIYFAATIAAIGASAMWRRGYCRRPKARRRG